MKTNRALIVVIIFLVIWNCFLTAQYFVNTESKEKENVTNVEVTGFSTDMSEVCSKVKSSVVSISSGGSISSGFVYKSFDDGFYAVTCAHAITDEQNISLILDNDVRVSGELVGRDIYSDIAVVKASCSFNVPESRIGDSELLKDGEYLLIAGTPSSLEFHSSFTVAMVSDRLRTIMNSITIDKATYSYYTSIIQLSADVSNGYSGAPLFNMAGECIGVITMKAANEVAAIPMAEVKLVADEIIGNGEVHKVIFGIKGEYIADMETYTKAALNINIEQVNGLYVSSTAVSSIASLAGIKSGDIIVSINGVELNSYHDYLNISYSGESVYAFSVYRAGETLEFTGIIND